MIINRLVMGKLFQYNVGCNSASLSLIPSFNFKFKGIVNKYGDRIYSNIDYFVSDTWMRELIKNKS